MFGRFTNRGHKTPTPIDKEKSKKKLWEDKQKVYLDAPKSFKCDDDTHPLFTIHVTKQQPIAVCYYCSKTWILKGEHDNDTRT